MRDNRTRNKGRCETMIRTDFYITWLSSTERAYIPVKVNGYVFKTFDHWFTIRKNEPPMSGDKYPKKWIISDLVTGLGVCDTNCKLADIPGIITQDMVDSVLNRYTNRKVQRDMQRFAQNINQKYYEENNISMVDKLQSSCGDLFNE